MYRTRLSSLQVHEHDMHSTADVMETLLYFQSNQTCDKTRTLALLILSIILPDLNDRDVKMSAVQIGKVLEKAAYLHCC